MATRPDELLIEYAHKDADEGKMVGVRVPLRLLREVWRYGVERDCRSEGRALLAVLKDWVRLRRLESPPPETAGETTRLESVVVSPETRRPLSDPADIRQINRLQGETVRLQAENERLRVQLDQALSAIPLTAVVVESMLDDLQHALESYQSFLFGQTKETLHKKHA